MYPLCPLHQQGPLLLSLHHPVLSSISPRMIETPLEVEDVESVEDMIPKETGELDTAGTHMTIEVAEELNYNREAIIPKPDMLFSSLEEVKDFYKKFAYDHGFGMFVRTSSKKTCADGQRRYYTFSCDRGGKTRRTSQNTLDLKPSSKVECQARLNVKELEDGRAIITGVILDHNHGLSPSKSRHLKCHKQLDAWAKRRLEMNDQAGISLNKNFHSLVVEAKGYENVTFDERNARNYIDQARRLRLGAGDAESLHNYFLKMQTVNPDFYYSIDVNEDGHIRNVFWADARSRALYESFGDVITFDTTYLTNKYDMPFAPFIGVNHHGQSTLLGCGLISDEKESTYVWLFNRWLACMSGVLPGAIVTDQCKSIGGAVSVVFKGVKHRLCLWHIMKKIPIKLGRLADYKPIKKTFKNIIYESLTVEEFEENWSIFMKSYNLDDHEWLKSLYIERERWIPVFLKETFWAGMSTTQRSEGMNAFFDGYVHSKTSLKQFVEQYDHALRSKVEKEKQADFASFNSIIPTISNFYFEKQFQIAYTNEIFKLFQNELKGLMYCNTISVKTEGSMLIYKVNDGVERKDGSIREVNYDVYFVKDECDIRCACHLFEFKGILCRHVISVLALNRVKEIPPRYILKRWRKDIKRKHSYIKSSYNDVEEPKEVKRLDMMNTGLRDITELGMVSDSRTEFVMRMIDYMKKKMLSEEVVSFDDRLTSQYLSYASTEFSGSGKEFKSPAKVRTKGRPPSKRKESKEEQFLKMKKKKVSLAQANRTTKAKQIYDLTSPQSPGRSSHVVGLNGGDAI